jgi:hypothetical protein
MNVIIIKLIVIKQKSLIHLMTYVLKGIQEVYVNNVIYLIKEVWDLLHNLALIDVLSVKSNIFNKFSNLYIICILN